MKNSSKNTFHAEIIPRHTCMHTYLSPPTWLSKNVSQLHMIYVCFAYLTNLRSLYCLSMNFWQLYQSAGSPSVLRVWQIMWPFAETTQLSLGRLVLIQVTHFLHMCLLKKSYVGSSTPRWILMDSEKAIAMSLTTVTQIFINDRFCEIIV